MNAAPSDNPVIRATDLRKKYGTGPDAPVVLRGVDFTVSRGECTYLVGPSGSGKTTLLSILGCVLTADSGRLELLGQDVTRFTPLEQARFRRERLGFVFQRFHLFGALTALDNVKVPLDLQGWPARRSVPRARELLALVGLADKASNKIGQLSMGQRQRVAFARALAGDPELILADEPTASLDAAAGLSAMRVLKDLCRDLRKTVVVVTHDSRIFDLADRILTMEGGRLRAGPGETADQSTSTKTAVGA